MEVALVDDAFRLPVERAPPTSATRRETTRGPERHEVRFRAWTAGEEKLLSWLNP